MTPHLKNEMIEDDCLLFFKLLQIIKIIKLDKSTLRAGNVT